MKQVKIETLIEASPEQVWQALWQDDHYKQWTRAFYPGSYAKSSWIEGEHVHFLSPGGNGMYAKIAKNEKYKIMSFQHLGEVKNFEEDKSENTWHGAYETYILEPHDGGTKLTTTIDVSEDFESYFQTTFPKAIDRLKRMSEGSLKPFIVVKCEVKADLDKVWDYYTNPEHIVKWNAASPDWHTTKASNDLKPGGTFVSRMEAKDGSMGFDFEGTYDVVAEKSLIAYELGDKRMVDIRFEQEGDHVFIAVQFDPENTHSPEMQAGGWQAILDNFKQYTENN